MAARAPKPTLEELQRQMAEGPKALYEYLRRGAATLPGVHEQVMFDAVLGGWVPGWSTPRGQLFHIHPEETLSATVVLREEDCPGVLASPAVRESIKRRLRGATRYGGSRWVHFALPDEAAVEEVLSLVACKNGLRRKDPEGESRGGEAR